MAATERVKSLGPLRPAPETASLVILHLLAGATVLLAEVDGFWRDEEVAYELVTDHTTIELLTTVPSWPPHFPTWFVFADVVGLPAAIWVSRLAMVALVYPTYRLGRAAASETAGHRAAFLVAASPFLAAQAGWLRMYGLLTAVLVWGLWFGYSGRHRYAAGCFIVAAAMHPFGVFGVLWLVIATDSLADQRTRLLAVVAATPLVAALAYIVSQQGLSVGPTGVYHGIAPGPLRVALTPATSVAGAPHTLFQVGLLLAGTALLISRDHDRQLVAWVALPVVGIVGASHLVQPIYRVKYFGLVAPAVAVLLAAMQDRHYRRAAAAACFTAAMAYSWVQRVTIPAIVARRFIFWF